MRFLFTIFLFCCLLSINGANVFAYDPVPLDAPPLACGGYNEKGGTCTAACKESEESATCINTLGETKPQCYCEAGNGGQSLSDFLNRLKAKVNEVDMIKNHIQFIQVMENITLDVDNDFFLAES